MNKHIIKKLTFKNVSITVVCIFLGIVLAWQFQSVRKNRISDSFRNERLENIKDELIRSKNNNDDLRKRNDEIENQMREMEKSSGNSTMEQELIKKELDFARVTAGLVEVSGSGLLITVDNGPKYSVDDGDLLLLINELKASEAQAISINDQRLIASTEIREAGKYISINRQQISAPFVVKAIADPNKLENALRVISGVLERFDEFNIKYSVEKRNDIIIPKVDSSVIKTDLLKPKK